MSKYVDREVFSYCAETCPAIDAAFADTLGDLRGIVGSDNHDALERWMDALLHTVKNDGTEKLRDALREAVSDKQAAEQEREQLERQVKDLETKVDYLEDEVAGLNKELSEVSA